MRPPEFWAKNNARARLAALALSPLGWLYGASVAWKRDHGKGYRPQAKVVCIGNLTAGGSGKTPVAIAVASRLRERGIRPVFLTRGYGGRLDGPTLVEPSQHAARDVGDEALLLATCAPTVIANNRESGAILADRIRAGAIVMDDGHQNFALAKDLSIVAVDAETGFGNGLVLPAGPLREPVAQGLARADAVVLVGDGEIDLQGFHSLILRAHLVPAPQNLQGRRVVAFAGIGRPAKFFASLNALGADILEANEFGDHHFYSAREIADLKASAERHGAQLMTTEKDFLRLKAAEKIGVTALPIVAQFEPREALDQLLEPIVRTAKAIARNHHEAA
jgi:tetraacyldisaccharide 4'-kinase